MQAPLITMVNARYEHEPPLKEYDEALIAEEERANAMRRKIPKQNSATAEEDMKAIAKKRLREPDVAAPLVSGSSINMPSTVDATATKDDGDSRPAKRARLSQPATSGEALMDVAGLKDGASNGELAQTGSPSNAQARTSSSEEKLCES